MKAVAQVGLCTLALTALVAGCGSDDDDTDDEPRRGFSQSGHNYVHGFAYADGPVSGARIRVYSTGGQLLADEPRSTERGGTFFVEQRGLPADYRVVATGGRHAGRPFRGELRAEVRRDDGAVIDVSPVSTITSDYIDQHPGTGLAKATDEVHEHLAIPSALDTEDLRVYDRYFDGKTFLAKATQGGGVKAYAKRVAQGAGGDGPRKAFPRRESNQAAELAQFAGQKLFDYLAAKIVEDDPESLLGQVLALTQDDTGKRFDEVNRNLREILAELAAVKASLGSIETQLKQTAYDNFVQGLRNEVAHVNRVNTDLDWLTKSTNREERKKVAKELIEFIERNMKSDIDTFDEALKPSAPGATSLMGAYREAVKAKASKGPMFTPADNKAIFSGHEYWDAYLVSALNAIVQWRRATGTPGKAQSEIDDVRGRRQKHQKALPARLPDDGAVDTRTNLYWKGTGNNVCGTFNGGPHDPTGRPGALNAGRPDPADNRSRRAGGGFKNWRMAKVDELSALVGGRSVYPPRWLNEHGFVDFPGFHSLACGLNFIFSSEYDQRGDNCRQNNRQGDCIHLMVGKRKCEGNEIHRDVEGERAGRNTPRHGPPVVMVLSGVGTINCAFVGVAPVSPGKHRPPRRGTSLVVREMSKTEQYW